MDERRALVAVVLIFVLLFGYNYYVRTRSAQAPAEPALSEQVESAPATARPVEQTEPADAPAREPSGMPDDAMGDATAGAELPDEGLEETLITVEGPLWTAVLTSRGASIVSWKLADYQTADGLPVELVQSGERALEGDVLYGATTAKTGDWVFEPSVRGRLVLREGDGPTVVSFSATKGGIGLTKEYTFHPDQYVFDLAIAATGLHEPAAQREIVLGWPGILQTEKNEDQKAFASSVMLDGKSTRTDLGKLKKEPTRRLVGEVAWATSQSRYFMAAAVPQEAAFTSVEVTGDVDRPSVGFAAALPLDGVSAARITIFAGPQDYRLISEIGAGLERAVDLGWRLTRPLSALMLHALVWAHSIIPNYGVVIIIFSILTKLLFYRLTHKSFTEMKRMQDLQPKQEELKAKYKDDKEALAKAQMELYKTEGVNPLGGCLPMVFQMPVFIALFQVLRTTIELRGAPFLLWITDLSQPDTIATIGSFPIHVLPLLMGVGMLVQQRFTSKDSSQAALGNMMPIVFTALFYSFSSGLVVYWLVNTILSVAQQYYIHRGPNAAAEQSVGAAAPGTNTGRPTATMTATPEFDVQEAEVVETSRSTNSKKKRSKSGKRRRAKR